MNTVCQVWQDPEAGTEAEARWQIELTVSTDCPIPEATMRHYVATAMERCEKLAAELEDLFADLATQPVPIVKAPDA